MTKKQELELIKASVTINVSLIQQLLNRSDILERNVEVVLWKDHTCPVRNRHNVELRQRMKALRKDMIRLERLMKDVW